MDCQRLNVNNSFGGRFWQKRRRHVKTAPLTMAAEDYLLYKTGWHLKRDFQLKMSPFVTMNCKYGPQKNIHSRDGNIRHSFRDVKKKDKCHVQIVNAGHPGLCFVCRIQFSHNWSTWLSNVLNRLKLKTHTFKHVLQ